jgi:hypothetical protein
VVTAEIISQIEGSAWFHARWAPYLVVDLDLRIRAVNAAYAGVTGRSTRALVGERLFDAFPDNPAEPGADGVANLSTSLDRVFTNGKRHWMGVQRYDVPDVRDPSVFVYKVWAPLNSPIRVRGETLAVLHHIQDVTHVLSENGPHGTKELMAAVGRLSRQFPDLSREAVTGVLTDSNRIVARALGMPRAHPAEALARLRLEVLSGHPALLPPYGPSPAA